MSARTISKGVLDARFSKLRAQVAQGSAGGALLPLPRDAFISSDSKVSGQNGSVAEPFKSIRAWLATQAAAGKTLGDNSTLSVGRLLPAVSGYTEALVIPAYRCLELRGDDFGGALTPVSGGITWANTAAAAAGGPAPPLAMLVLHNINEQGALVVTDDGSVPSNIIISGDEVPAVGIASGINALGATAVTAIIVSNQEVSAGIESTTSATGAEVALLPGAVVVGNVICRVLASEQGEFNSSVIQVGNSAAAAGFFSTLFVQGSGPVLTGLAGSGVLFDGSSWRSFLEAGGSVVTSFVLVIGGYSAGAVEGANLTNANVAVSLNGLGAGTTAGFTAGGNHYTLPPATLTGAHTCKLLLGGGELPGDTIRISRADASANTYQVLDDTNANIATLAVSSKGFVEARFNGTHWVYSAAAGGLVT